MEKSLLKLIIPVPLKQFIPYDLNESELSKIDNRTDGKVEVIDVKLNNRKTKKLAKVMVEKIKNQKQIA